MESAEDSGLVAWHHLVRTYSELFAELERRMRAQHGISLAEFDVLFHAADAQGEVLLQRDLARRALLTPVGTTRLLDRLESAGLLRRSESPADRRGKAVSLTAQGAAMVEASSTTHAANVDELFSRKFSADDLVALSSLLQRVSPVDEIGSRQ